MTPHYIMQKYIFLLCFNDKRGAYIVEEQREPPTNMWLCAAACVHLL